jgi:DDE superfamily endonuclease
MDEVHFQQYGSRCRMWIPPEVKDPVLQHHPTRKSVGYFGAVRLRDGKFLFAREHYRFDAMTTWDFLRLLHCRSLKSRRRVVVITDNAKYHHAKLHSAWRQEHERNSTLITCRLTALISIPSKGSGNLPESFASTTNISRALEQ